MELSDVDRVVEATTEVLRESGEVTTTVSVVIPVYNEEAGLESLFARLYPALDQLGRPYEVIFVDDGSSDRSAAVLRTQFERRPDTRGWSS